MALSGYAEVPVIVSIVMASAIHENHVVTISPPVGAPGSVAFNTSSVLAFTPANWNTPQTVSVTAHQTGGIELPYVVTSIYTARTKKGVIDIAISPVPVDTWIGVPNNGGAYRFGSQALIVNLANSAAGTVSSVLGIAHIIVSTAGAGHAISINRTTGTSVSLFIRDPSGTVTALGGNPASYTPSVAGEYWLYASTDRAYSLSSVNSTLQLKDRSGVINVTITADMATATPITGLTSVSGHVASYGTPLTISATPAVISSPSGIRVTGADAGSIIGLGSPNITYNSSAFSAASDTQVHCDENWTILAGSPQTPRQYFAPILTVADGSGAPSIEGALSGAVSNIWQRAEPFNVPFAAPGCYFEPTYITP